MKLFKRKNDLSSQYLNVLEAIYHEDSEMAVKLLTEAVSGYTEQAVPYLWLGRLLFEKDELLRAEVIFRNLAHRPRLSKELAAAAWRGTAQCSKRLGHVENQIEALGSYIRVAPQDTLAAAEYFYARAKQALTHNNRKGAVNYLYESISVDNRYGEAFIMLGDIVGEDSPTRGIRIWRRLLKQRPDLIQTLHGRFRSAYDLMGSPERFEKFLRKLSARSPIAGFPFLVLARYYLEIGEIEHAKENFVEAKLRPVTHQTALVELNKIAIDKWDQKGALVASDELINAMSEPSLVWRCGNCGDKRAVQFLEHCDICENWVDIIPVQGLR